jgi:hypothetical protein
MSQTRFNSIRWCIPFVSLMYLSLAIPTLCVFVSLSISQGQRVPLCCPLWWVVCASPSSISPTETMPRASLTPSACPPHPPAPGRGALLICSGECIHTLPFLDFLCVSPNLGLWRTTLCDSLARSNVSLCQRPLQLEGSTGLIRVWKDKMSPRGGGGWIGV